VSKKSRSELAVHNKLFMTLQKAINESELRLNAFAEIDHELISEML
jgi:hypothetical protein